MDAAQGRPAICRKSNGECVELLSQDCEAVVPQEALANDNTIVVGFMGALRGEYESLGRPINRGAELAIREIQLNANGLPGGPGGTRRPLAMLSCHDLDDSGRTATHLMVDVGVPAIIGPLFSGITIKTATEVAIPKGVLLLSPSATTPTISDLDDNGLVWRTAPSDAIQAIPLAKLVEEQEAHIRSTLQLEPTDQVRVAVAVKGDAYGQGLADALSGLLRFNGKTVADNGNNYRRENYDDPATNPNFDYSTLVTNLVAFKPHIVIPLGTNEVDTKILDAVEKAWPTTGTVPPRPRWLLPDGGRITDLLDVVAGNDDLRKRVSGTVPGRKGTNYNAFKLRYKGQYNNEEPGAYSDSAYDAGYLLAYAILGGGEGSPTGASVRAGLEKMSSGTTITTGPSDINKAMNLLQTDGQSINYDGASGPLDFNPDTGDAAADIDIWCIVVDQSAGTPVFLSSGRYYDAASGQMSGTASGCE